MRRSVVALLAATCAAAGCTRAEDTLATSLLLVTLDTLRVDHVGAYAGGESLTPALDRLAAEGLVYENAFTTMPSTAPAHLSLFTGLLPSEHRSRANGVPLSLSYVARSLPALLAERGYATAAVTTSSLLSRYALGLHGFDFFDSPGGDGVAGNEIRWGREAVTVALDWLDGESRRPVFLWVHLYDPHSPYGSAQERMRYLPIDRSAYGWVDRDRYPPAERARMAELYAHGVRELDGSLGRLVDGVRAKVHGPLLVVAVADHGEVLDEYLDGRGYAFDHGEFLDPEAIRIPLLLAGEGVEPGRSTGAVSIRDLYTTLLAAAGLGDPEAEAEGRRDLRHASAARRIVTVERRSFRSPVRAEVRAHARAASDGEQLVILGEDGSATVGSADRDADLVAAARARSPEDTTPPPLPAPEVRKALEALGYAE